MRVTSGEVYTTSYPIDVNGIQVKVKEASLDKAKYAATDAMNLSLTVESNQNLSATLKTWIVDPEGTIIFVTKRKSPLTRIIMFCPLGTVYVPDGLLTVRLPSAWYIPDGRDEDNVQFAMPPAPQYAA